MSEETLDVRARLVAVNEMSPAIRRVIADFKKLESVANGVSGSFANIGRTGMESFAGLNRTAQAAVAQMRGISNTAKAASQSYVSDWRKATDQRLSDTRKMYSQLDRLEAQYQRQIERRAAAERRAERSGTGRVGIGNSGRLPAPRISAIMLGGGVIGAGVASVLKKRMDVQSAEVRSQMFGDLSPKEVQDLRKSYADRAGIRFGVGTSKALDVATEGLKAGIAKQFAGDFGELALKAQSGLDIPVEDTAKLMGRLSSQMAFNKARYNQILNAIAVANNATAADGKEIVEAMRRSLSALATTKMTPEELAALDSTAISLGVQPFKAGTFISFLTSQIAGADSAHGQNAKDLNSAASALGFGGRGAMAAMMRDNPIQAIQQILDGLAKMPEKLRTKVAKEIGGREWMDELLTLVLGKDKLQDVLRDVATKQGFLDKVALQKIRSMQGRWASIQAAFGLVWEKVGAGFEGIFDQITDAVIELADKFNFDSIKDHFTTLIDGMREGFGLNDWGDIIKTLASELDAGTIKKWRSFGKGFAEGIKDFIIGLKTAFNVLAFFSGGKDDAEGLGKLVAKLTGLTIALSLLSPVLTLFAGVVTILATANPFARLVIGFVSLAVGIKKVLDFVADKVFSVFIHIVDGIKGAALSAINTVRGWIGLAPIGGGGPGASGSWDDGSVRKQSFLGPSNDAAASFQKASYSGGIINRATIPSFNGGGGSAGGLDRAVFDRKFAGSALAGKYDQIVAEAKAQGIPPALLAGIIAHETGNGVVLSGNNPGGVMDPATGMSRKMQFGSLDDGIRKTAQVVGKRYREAGGDLDKLGSVYAPPGAANDPLGQNGGWVGGVRKQMNAMAGADVGSAGTGDAVGWAEKYKGMNEYTDYRVLASTLGGDVRGKSNAWCARFVNTALAQAGGKGTGSAVANSYQRWGTAINPPDVKRNDVLLQPNSRGYNQPGGHVGLATGGTRMVNGRLQVKMIAGNDGDAVREHWIDADKNLMVRRGDPIGNVPTPAEAVRNVPPVPTGGALGAGGMRGGFGPSTININGNSHDPEALANLVQRRIDESMQWRMHDTESEYT